MPHGHLQDVCFLQLRMAGALAVRQVWEARTPGVRQDFRAPHLLRPPNSPPTPTYILPEGVQDEALELREAFIDARAAPLLHDRLGGLWVGLWLSPASVRPTHAPQPTPHRAPTFRCSAALRGSFGVLWAPAGAPASGDALGFPGVSAGMVRPRASGARRSAAPGASARRAQLSPMGPQLQARAPSCPPLGYLRRRGRGVCEPRSAFVPTLSPANERLRSPGPARGRPPPAAAPAERQSVPAPARDQG